MTGDKRKIAIIGCGRIGAPMLSWMHNLDIPWNIIGVERDRTLINKIRAGELGWFEDGLDEQLKQNPVYIVHEDDRGRGFWDTVDLAIICLGSPVNEYGEPQVDAIRILCSKIPRHVNIVLRSTVPVGFSRELSILLDRPIYFAPERILTGSALSELDKLPQVLGVGQHQLTLNDATIMDIFEEIFPTVHVSSLEEAELSKIGNNIMRYIEFTAGTQFAEACEYYGVNWSNVQKLMTAGYDRGRMCFPSFTSSYCLNKDYMMLHRDVQPSLSLASANYNQLYFLETLWHRALSLSDHAYIAVGILGWTYRPESDDDRDTIVEYLGEYLKDSGNVRHVTYFDPVKNPSEEEFQARTGFGKHAWQGSSARAVIDSSDIIWIATAHPEFESLNIPPGKIVIDPSGKINGNDRFVRWYD
jgi:nucleotide sugar dehydrogenase